MNVTSALSRLKPLLRFHHYLVNYCHALSQYWPRPALQLHSWPETALFTEYFLMRRRLARPDTHVSPPPEPTLTKLPGLPAAPSHWWLVLCRMPKQGNTLDECEDAWAFAYDQECQVCEDYDEHVRRRLRWPTLHNRLTLAISDGASDSFAPAQWARLLTRQAVQDRIVDCPRERLLRWLRDLGEHWRASLDLNNLPWYAIEKAERGAHATLLVLDLAPNSQGGTATWLYKVLAIGDSCLFHFRNQRLQAMFPQIKAEDFGASPHLVASNHDYNKRHLTQQAIIRGQGDFEPGDELWLMTDALAAWVSQACAACTRMPNIRMRDIVTFFDQLRKGNRMRNDDVTLLRLFWQQS
ncbi:hypothetical protein HRbin36_00832 [bacterium HR36]|nr:hypothetical protein HRbin36_00832 [bacterium HR36]